MLLILLGHSGIWMEISFMEKYLYDWWAFKPLYKYRTSLLGTSIVCTSIHFTWSDTHQIDDIKKPKKLNKQYTIEQRE